MQAASVHHLAADVYVSRGEDERTVVGVLVHLQIHQLLLHFKQLQPPIRIERPSRTRGNSNNIKGIVTGLEVLVVEVLLVVAFTILRM